MPPHRTANTRRTITATAPLLDVSDLSERRFQTLDISAKSKQGIKHEFMTKVQSLTLEHALSGENLLVQARTGTGKTLAFLLPCIETIAKTPERKGISALILAPTRELALQIQAEALPLASQHGVRVACVFGGGAKAAQQAKLLAHCDILVATPGRLVDLVENYLSGPYFSSLKFYVLDEVDRMLDVGFLPDLAKINRHLPNTAQVPRQSLFFSATIDKNVRDYMTNNLKSDYKFVKTVSDDEKLTHERVSQTHIITPFRDHLPTLLHLVQQDQATHGKESKIIVFITTARQTSVSCDIFNKMAEKAPSLKSLELHSRLTQSRRTATSDQFRKGTGILFASDVAARGVDFPGVTLVVQVGLPQNGEQYIHRLGRTARAGAEGRGIIILDRAEQAFLKDRALAGISITPANAIPQDVLQPCVDQVQSATSLLDDTKRGQTYAAWLGYYKGAKKTTRWESVELVQQAEEWVRDCLGWTQELPPPLLPKTVGMMQLKGVPGLNVQKPPRLDDGSAPQRPRRAVQRA
ncbi:DEAD-domain-containing protein [Hymenopellis radicata]|nr:DEAD-domain-containing protein [Hymenopellis radicata]